MTIYRLDILKRVAIGSIVGLLVLLGLGIRAHFVYLNYNFNGCVDSIKYGDKGVAIISIRGKEYVLDEQWAQNSNNTIIIQKGDSMIKFKDSTTVILKRRNGITVIK